MSKNYIFLFVFLFLFYTSNSQISTCKTDLQIGFSMPEFLHLGAGFQLSENTRLNANFGVLPDRYKPFFNSYSITGGFSFYFGKIHEKRLSKRWAYNPEISFLKDETIYYKWKYFYLNNSISYDFYISSNFIFQPELGFLLELSEVEIEKPEAGQSWFGKIGPDSPILPILGFKLKYLL